MAPSAPGLPSAPSSVVLTAEERSSGTWSRANLQRAMELMHRDGILVIEGIVDKANLEALREDMLKTSAVEVAKKTDSHQFNHGIKSNYLLSPPLDKEHLRFPDVYQNPWLVQIVEAYLGSDLQMPFITANVALRNTTQRQPIHKDTSFVHPAAPFMAIANFLLSDFRPENGSTEFWLGSHNSSLAVEQMWRSKDAQTPTCDVIPAIIEERRLTRPPCQVTVPFGGVLLRDVRTWHCGMPNPSDEDRIMVAVAYQSSWFTRDLSFWAPESAKSLLTGNPKVHTLSKFIPDEEWSNLCQKYGKDEPMFLRYGPNPEGWDSIAMVKPEDKYVNKEFNPHAI